ncbi:hypothetical protein QLL95_gp1158 [Cotonvirus japonicus]|uniref:DUF1308 domain-containing protein n=1 Tax=Cotonvirus japonicus TaxID=2811091 RepID=A0ABM7NS29_9VIRU|nr:hypothetical protein QLL95_gp1158 [Cotonvirus japonicus]BCS82965.1 hypothetical protein [Cotonvirus japonicus]
MCNSEITCWTNLVKEISCHDSEIFKELLVKVKRTINSHKHDKKFDVDVVKKPGDLMFDLYKQTFIHLLIETDVTELFTEIPSLTSNNHLTLNMTSIGKWIKIHNKESSNIYFIDDEKTIISDRALADFLNKVQEYKNEYFYFGKNPLIYYKFQILPPQDIIEHMASFGVIAIEYGVKTPTIKFDDNFNKRVLLDQATILTICSNLSAGLSDNFYAVTKEPKTKEMVMENIQQIQEFILGKEIIVNKSVYDQTISKLEFTAGPAERQRFDEFSKCFIIVEDCENPRYTKMKDTELICISVAERETATIVTNNKHVMRKIELFYNEIPCKLFMSVQLSETKYQ